ncbi:hypothetical protein GCM10011579_086600 [Streptomyces albiflavescens]|uniref:Uncharacterized protein n=1 Tax=Streptomyces albiflavescens TaxID=1623582 RepID=A0A917YD47_9ACTN|nr:hypothetical protein [Streptomyces albiflavescens]GGN90587.1 hypothetical protein GCM10011579_086600 [Streptomyces albiflavescens]
MSEYINFVGSVAVSPTLNPSEVRYLERFAATRRMSRASGPYSTIETGRLVIPDGDILDVNTPPTGQPGLSCQWVPANDGTRIEWNRRSKFRFADEWLAYIIDHFLAPDAVLAQELSNPVEGRYYAPEFADFTFDHTLNGSVDAYSEFGERWQLVVNGNAVSLQGV